LVVVVFQLARRRRQPVGLEDRGGGAVSSFPTGCAYQLQGLLYRLRVRGCERPSLPTGSATRPRRPTASGNRGRHRQTTTSRARTYCRVCRGGHCTPRSLCLALATRRRRRSVSLLRCFPRRRGPLAGGSVSWIRRLKATMWGSISSIRVEGFRLRWRTCCSRT
jgi:hypothetical protein